MNRLNKHFPPAAICDKDGRPLLSWRVAILPYLDEERTLQGVPPRRAVGQPHNSTLIDKMPDVYADPDRKSLSCREGKTTYQVPVGPENMFFNNEGHNFRDITDGTSNTHLIVEVRAIARRRVDQDRPIGRSIWKIRGKASSEATANSVTAAFADGHVELVNLAKTDDKQLRAILTRAGGEVIDPLIMLHSDESANTTQVATMVGHDKPGRSWRGLLYCARC